MTAARCRSSHSRRARTALAPLARVSRACPRARSAAAATSASRRVRSPASSRRLSTTRSLKSFLIRAVDLEQPLEIDGRVPRDHPLPTPRGAQEIADAFGQRDRRGPQHVRVAQLSPRTESRLCGETWKPFEPRGPRELLGSCVDEIDEAGGRFPVQCLGAWLLLALPSRQPPHRDVGRQLDRRRSGRGRRLRESCVNLGRGLRKRTCEEGIAILVNCRSRRSCTPRRRWERS